jgi:hypothetical protein
MSSETVNRSDYLNRTEVKLRDWTDSLIKKYLIAPDERRRNPRAGGAPIQWFLLERVLTAEASSEFAAARQALEKRRESGRQNAEKRRQQIKEHIESLVIEVPNLEWDDLLRRACANYNALPRSDRNGSHATPNSDGEFLDRICVNYLRHVKTYYDSHLEAVFRKAGANDARLQIKLKVLDAIAKQYPELELECWRQADKAETAHYAE